MNKRSTKFYRKNEAEVMKRLGFKPTKNSGAGWIEKCDGQSELFICELKSTDKESYTLKQKTLQELEYHACVAHKPPIFALQFLNRDEVWVAITEEEFKESYDFVDSIDFYETHIFKYSRREGTKAAVMPDQVDEQIKAKRSAQLIELGEKKRAAYEQSFQGKEVEVLVEEDLELNGKEVQIGHTKEYMKIALERNENLKNSIVKVQIGKDSQIIH